MSRHLLSGAAALSLLFGAAAAAQTGGLATAAFEGAPEWMAALYAERDYDPVWSDRGRPSAAFDALVSTVAGLGARGLDPADYGAGRLERLRGESVAVRERGAAMVFAKLALDLAEGRTDPELDYQPNFAPLRERKKGALLAEAYAEETPLDWLAEVTPDNFLVERLIEAKARYRRLEAEGGWPSLPTEDVLIKEGDAHGIVPALRDRLRAEGFHPGRSRAPNPAEDSDVFDAETAASLKAFQRSRSLKDDGVVGPNTLAALNETPAQLAARLDVNIERARWLPSRLGDRAVFVNAADYTLRLYEGGRLTDRMPVIVGKDRTQTPIFADTMESVVVNPYWNVPASILIGEIAPKQIADPGYIEAKNFEVIRGGQVVAPSAVDWQAAADGSPSFRVRQRSGPTNALGRIKFLFPNKYAVYLHDTPSKSLFERDVRTFSHGCIRVSEPVKFGSWLLGKSEAELQRMIDSGERTEMPSPATPVYITYFTAWASPEGEVTFARDVYDRDAKVAANLRGGA